MALFQKFILLPPLRSPESFKETYRNLQRAMAPWFFMALVYHQRTKKAPKSISVAGTDRRNGQTDDAKTISLQLRLWIKRSEKKLQRKPGESVVFRCSRAANSLVSDEIWPKFKLIHTFIYVLVTYKNEEIQMKSGHNIIQLYFLRSRAANSVAGGLVWWKIKLIQTFMEVLVTCKIPKWRC